MVDMIAIVKDARQDSKVLPRLRRPYSGSRTPTAISVENPRAGAVVGAPRIDATNIELTILRKKIEDLREAGAATSIAG
jgi:hypothetical protein